MNCCSHLFEIGNVTPGTPNGCEECLKMGDRWLHLRLPFELLEDALGMETIAKTFEAANLRKGDPPLHRGPD